MKKLLFLTVSFSAAALAQIPLPPDVDKAVAGTVDWGGLITKGVTDLVTSVAPSVMKFGWVLLGIFGVYALLQALLQGTLRQLSNHHYQPLASVVAYVAVLFRIAIASLMLTFYMNPIPGLGINFHQIFPSLAQGLTSAVNTDNLKAVMGFVNDVSQYLPPVGVLQVLPGLITVVVILLMAVSQLALTIITASSYAIVGVLSICGPLMIPFYVLPGYDKKFWNWFDNMLVYSMYGFIAACFAFMWSAGYVKFFSSMTSYSVGQWVVGLASLLWLTVSCLWVMFKVPDLAHMIFGGIGGVASGIANTMQGLAVRGIASLF